MKTRKTFDSVRDYSTRNQQGGMGLLAVFTLLSLGVLGSGCGYGGYPASTGGGWSVAGAPQCSNAIAGANVPGGNFAGCILNGENLNETDFSYADFDGAELNNAKFWLGTYDAILVGTKFTNVEAEDVDFTNADLTEADFRSDTPNGTNLQWAVFDGAILIEARMNEADLRGASFAGASLDCANLQGADLRNADFTGASLVNADLTGAQLDGAIFDSAVMTGANLNGTNWADPGVLLVALTNVQSSVIAITAAACVPLP